jgi:hypothetical protein
MLMVAITPPPCESCPFRAPTGQHLDAAGQHIGATGRIARPQSGVGTSQSPTVLDDYSGAHDRGSPRRSLFAVALSEACGPCRASERRRGGV